MQRCTVIQESGRTGKAKGEARAWARGLALETRAGAARSGDRFGPDGDSVRAALLVRLDALLLHVS